MGEDVSTIGRGQRQRETVRLRQSFSPFGETFDSGSAYQARVTARQAMENARMPRLYGTTDIDFGEQGKASIRRVGTERKGSLQITLNGRSAGSVDYNEDGRGMFRTTADDAFREAKRRLGYSISI